MANLWAKIGYYCCHSIYGTKEEWGTRFMISIVWHEVVAALVGVAAAVGVVLSKWI